MGNFRVLLLSNLLQRFIRQGTLRVRDAGGKVHVFGGRQLGPDVALSTCAIEHSMPSFSSTRSYMPPKPTWTAR